MKILILRFSSIGDIVLTTPVVRCLKRKFPDSEIHYATKKAFLSIVQHNPYITKVHLLDDSLSALVRDLKLEKFDYVIDLHHNQRTWVVKFRLGVKSFSFDKINFEKWLMVNFKINKLPGKHIVDRYIDTCKTLGVENDGVGLDYFISKDEEVDIKTLPEGFQHGYVGWVVGAKQNTKRFPVDKIINATRQIKAAVILLGGREDAEAAGQIIASGNSKNIFNVCGKYSLNQSASLIRQAKLIVSNDTGLGHIAAAYKKPIISIWGNTIPAFGMAPYFGKKQIPNPVFQIEDLECRPCSKLGYEVCPLGHFNCMNMIDEAKLGRTVDSLFYQAVSKSS